MPLVRRGWTKGKALHVSRGGGMRGAIGCYVNENSKNVSIDIYPHSFDLEQPQKGGSKNFCGTNGTLLTL